MPGKDWCARILFRDGDRDPHAVQRRDVSGDAPPSVTIRLTTRRSATKEDFTFPSLVLSARMMTVFEKRMIALSDIASGRKSLVSPCSRWTP